MGSPSKKLEVTAHHEAGHAVTMWWLGIPFKEVTIVPNAERGHLGAVLCERLPRWFNLETNRDDPRVRHRVEQEIICLFAGQIADRKFRGCRPRSWRQSRIAASNYGDDTTSIDMAIHFHGGKTLEVWLDYLSLCAQDLVGSRWWEIRHIAKELLSLKRLTYADFIACMNRKFEQTKCIEDCDGSVSEHLR